MSYKIFVYLFFVISFSFIFLVGVVDFFIDPFNIFSHQNYLNKLQIDFNERLQKSVYLFYNTSLDYDALLLGSSRSTYYNQNDFEKAKLYNFSFSGAEISEYKKYIDFFNNVNQNELKMIILGLDFYTYRKNNHANDIIFPYELKILFFIKNYFSLYTLKYSLINMKRSYFNKTGHRSYDRNNIVKSDIVNSNISISNTLRRSKNYYNKFEVDYTYEGTLLDLKNRFKNTKFIIFIPPLSKPFLDKIYNNKELFSIYLKWLRSLINVFEKVYLFSIPNNEWSTNYKEYTMDGDHFYPKVGTEIFHQIGTNKLKDGILLTKGNFNEVFSFYLNRER